VRLIPLGVAAVAAALYLAGLGAAPFIDPPEGFHAEIAREMVAAGDWVTPRLNGVRYFDKPPLLHWLLAGLFAVTGPSPAVARLPSALAAVACAAVTARLGLLLGGPRVGLLGGLMTAANLGLFLFGRLVKPDLVFVLCLTVAWAGFAAAYLGRGGRWGLALFWGGLGLATLAKDLLGALGPLVAVASFFWLTRERPVAPWRPWWALALFAAVAVPWYAAAEAASPGFLWYTVVDNHLLNVARQRVFPDEDVPLGPLEFLLVTVAAFLPWSLAAPAAIARALRGPWADARARLWALLALWALLVVGFFTVAPFKLPHYGLPAFPALALLAARRWDEAIARDEPARGLVLPLVPLFAAAAGALAAAAAGVLPLPSEALTAVDVTTRNLAARGQLPAGAPLEAYRPVLVWGALVCGLGAAGAALALRRRSSQLGVAVALGAMLAFLPLAGKGMAEFARGRAAAPLVEALLACRQPGEVVIHEGALENTGSLLLALGEPVRVVDGLVSNLAFGATFPEARAVFWTADRVQAAWAGPGRVFLVSVVAPERSVVRTLPRERVHLLAAAGPRRLYSNVGD